MTTTFAATASRPGPDDNVEAPVFGQVPSHRRPYVAEARMILGDAQTAGKPYRYLEGRAVPYDTWADIGWFMESHAAGSFKKSTKEAARQAPLLLFHDNRSWPIGHAESWRHEADGMHGVWRLEETPEAQRAAALADSGSLIGLSIGFQPVRSDWELVDDWAPELGADHKDRVTRTESRLLEVSMTPTPAFAEATVTGTRDAVVYTRSARAAFLGPLEVDGWRTWRATLRA